MNLSKHRLPFGLFVLLLGTELIKADEPSAEPNEEKSEVIEQPEAPESAEVPEQDSDQIVSETQSDENQAATKDEPQKADEEGKAMLERYNQYNQPINPKKHLAWAARRIVLDGSDTEIDKQCSDEQFIQDYLTLWATQNNKSLESIKAVAGLQERIKGNGKHVLESRRNPSEFWTKEDFENEKQNINFAKEIFHTQYRNQ